MTHFSDDIYLGGFFGTQPFSQFVGGGQPMLPAANPTMQVGAGPAGRVFFQNVAPATLAAANLAALQVVTSGTGLTLAAGAGITAGTAPDGSGRAIYFFDTPRCVSLTSTANLSAINFLVTGYDLYGRQQTQLVTGPNNATVNTLKAFAAVLSIVPTGTSASQISAGNSDVFGLPWLVADAGYIMPKWANVLAQNAGTLVVADQTSPATNLTGDTRGTYAQSGAASNGSRRLVIWIHLIGNQVGASPLVTNLIGVTPV